MESQKHSSVKRKFAKPPAIHFPGTVVTLSVMTLTATTTLSIAMYNSAFLLIQCCQNPTSIPLYKQWYVITYYNGRYKM